MPAAHFLVAGPEVTVGCFRADVDSTYKVIGEGADTVLPAAGVQLEVVSSALQDGAAGTGTREVTLVYLDADGDIQVTTIATNGLTPATSTPVNMRALLQVYSSDWGTADKNAGILTIRKVGDTGDVAAIPIGRNGWVPGAYTIPAGHQAMFLGGEFFGSANARQDVFIESDIDLDTGALDVGKFVTLPAGALTMRRVGKIAGLDASLDDRDNMTFPALSTIRAVGYAAGSEVVAGFFKLRVYPV